MNETIPPRCHFERSAHALCITGKMEAEMRNPMRLRSCVSLIQEGVHTNADLPPGGSPPLSFRTKRTCSLHYGEDGSGDEKSYEVTLSCEPDLGRAVDKNAYLPPARAHRISHLRCEDREVTSPCALRSK